MTALDFINAVRALCGLPARTGLPLSGCVRDSDERCVVAAALGVPVGGSAHPAWAAEGRWVIRFGDSAAACRVGTSTGQAWLADPAEVDLPAALVDLAVSHHFGLVVPDDAGCVRSWWLPDGEGFPTFCTPTDARIGGDVESRPAAVPEVA